MEEVKNEEQVQFRPPLSAEEQNLFHQVFNEAYFYIFKWHSVSRQSSCTLDVILLVLND